MLTTSVARGQDATIVEAHRTGDPDPAAPGAGLDAWALPLDSRTDLLDHVGRDTPGVVLREAGLSIHGAQPHETQLMLDGVRVSRLRAPIAMLQGVYVARAGHGAALADVTGGAVGAVTRAAPDRWVGTVDLFRGWGHPQDGAITAAVAGPLLANRLHLLVSGQTERQSLEPRSDPQGLLPPTPEVDVLTHRGGLQLMFHPAARQRIALLAVGSLSGRDNTATLGYTPEAQPRWEERHGLLALRWRGGDGRAWQAGAHLALEGTGTREFPQLCLTRPDCDYLPVNRLSSIGLVFGVFDHRQEDRERRLDAAAWLLLALPGPGNWRSSLRLGWRLERDSMERAFSVPGDQLNEFILIGSALARDRQTQYFTNDPRRGGARLGIMKTRLETLQGLQFVEWPVQAFSRLHLTPGLGLVTASGSGGGNLPAASALTHHLAGSFELNRPWGVWLRASTHRRADGDLRPLLELAAPTLATRSCRFDAASEAYTADCLFRSGDASIGLSCGPDGLDQTGRPCRQGPGLPRTWEHTATVEADPLPGLHLQLDAVHRRTHGQWARFETNRVWNIVGDDATFQRFRSGRAEEDFDVSAPAGTGLRHTAVTASLARSGPRSALWLAYTRGRTRRSVHPLRGLTITDDDHGRHAVHLQALVKLGDHASLSARYRYQQAALLVPLFFNPVLATWERFRSTSPASGAGTSVRAFRPPGVNTLNLQLRASLRRLTGVDVQAYADAMNVLGSVRPTRVEQRSGILFGTVREYSPPRWFRIGLQAGL